MNTAPGNLWEYLMTFNAGERFPLTVVIIVFGSIALVFTVGILSHTIKSMHRSRMEDALKRELVDRGMSAEEIERIIQARGDSSGEPKSVHVEQHFGDRK